MTMQIELLDRAIAKESRQAQERLHAMQLTKASLEQAAQKAIQTEQDRVQATEQAQAKQQATIAYNHHLDRWVDALQPQIDEQSAWRAQAQSQLDTITQLDAEQKAWQKRYINQCAHIAKVLSAYESAFDSESEMATAIYQFILSAFPMNKWQLKVGRHQQKLALEIGLRNGALQYPTHMQAITQGIAQGRQERAQAARAQAAQDNQRSYQVWLEWQSSKGESDPALLSPESFVSWREFASQIGYDFTGVLDMINYQTFSDGLIDD